MASQGFSASFCSEKTAASQTKLDQHWPFPAPQAQGGQEYLANIGKQPLQNAERNLWDYSSDYLTSPGMAGPRTRPRPVNPPTPPPYGPRPGPHPPVPPGNPTPPPSPRRPMWTGEGGLVRTIILACFLDWMYPASTPLKRGAKCGVYETCQSLRLPAASLISIMS
ncbi:hypothetical protein RB595_010168 [Gaeumannomyces hyphopodioides]